MIGELPEASIGRMSSVVQYALSLVGLVYGSVSCLSQFASVKFFVIFDWPLVLDRWPCLVT